MLLRIPEPYDFELSTVRFRDFGTDGATVLHEGGLHRVVGGRGGAGHRRARRRRDRALERRGGRRRSVGCSAFRSTSSRFALRPRKDTILGPIVELLGGFRPTLNPQPFEALVVAITTQQISLRAAAAIRGNLVRALRRAARRRLGVPDEGAGQGAPATALHAARLLAREGRVRARARALEPGSRRPGALDDDEVIASITSVRGLGRWTADWFLARHLARPHAWPAGDLGLRKAVSTFYAAGQPLSIEEVRRMSERFAPFENLSAQFLLAGARMAG